MAINHIIEARQFDKEFLEEKLFPLTGEMEKIAGKGGSQILSSKRMISFFCEPSTRTRCSFEAAMDFLGGKVVFSAENARISSSLAKGESIEDTVRILNGCHPDVLVLRTDKEGLVKRAALVSRVPIINAGDGAGEHPTQALTDLYTIKKEFKKIDGLKIGIIGDPLYARAIHSLIYLLSLYKVEIYFYSPKALFLPAKYKNYLSVKKIKFKEFDSFNENIKNIDVFYITRVQHERFSSEKESKKVNLIDYRIDKKFLKEIKKEARILHVLPRLEEISSEVDSDNRAVYFKQAENGLYVRMALLKMILTN